MTPKKSGIAASAISGVSWNYIGSVSSTIASFTIGAILARILGPRPFGQVIIATMIYGFVNMFVDGGFSQALIQKRELEEIQIRRTFTCQLGIGLFLSSGICLGAPWIARAFHDPTAVPVIRATSLMVFMQALGLVSSALLKRSMRFKVIQYSNLSSYLFGYVFVGIPLALHGSGVWSLVFAYLSQATLNAILLYSAVRHSVVPSFRFPDRSIAAFGGTVIATNIVNWGHSNLDNVASSRLGPFALGLYGRASNLAYQPVTTVVSSVNSVLLSSSSKAQQKPELLRNLVLSMLGILFGIIGPAYMTLALIPDTVIVGLYGNKWLQSIPIMIPLALAMPFYGGMGMLGPVLAGVGRPGLEFWPQAITCGLAAIAFFTASHYSIIAIAWALFGVAILRLATVAWFTFRQLDISWATALGLVGKRIAMSAVFGIVVYCADHLLRLTKITAGLRLTLIAVFAVALLGAMVWTIAHVLFGRHAIRFLLGYADHLPSRYVRQLRLRTSLPASAAVDQTGFD